MTIIIRENYLILRENHAIMRTRVQKKKKGDDPDNKSEPPCKSAESHRVS